MASPTVQDATDRIADAVKKMNAHHQQRADHIQNELFSSTEISAIADERARNLLQYMPDTRDMQSGLDPIHYHNTPITLNVTGITSRGGGTIAMYIVDTVNVTATKENFTQGTPVTLSLNGDLASGVATLRLIAHSNGAFSDPFMVQFAFASPTSIIPTILTPVKGETSAATSIIFTSSGYVTEPLAYDTLINANWVVTDSTGTVVADTVLNSDFHTFELPGTLAYETDYAVKVRYKGSTLGWGEFCDPRAFRTRIQTGPGTLFYEPDGITLKGIGGPIIEGHQIVVAASNRRPLSRGGLFKINTSLEDVTNSNTDETLSGYDGCQLLLEHYSAVVDVKGNVGPVSVFKAKELGDEWYVPTIKELEGILSVGSTIDSADPTEGKTLASIGNAKIHSRTEYSNQYSWYMTGNGNKGVSSKNQNRYLLPVYQIRL